jgi:hypothetical protein
VKPKLTDEQGLAVEVLDILWSAYLLRHHCTGSDDPIEAMRSLKILRLLSDDLVLRLCKLRDRDKRSLNFQNVLGRASRRLGPQQVQVIRDRISAYVRAVGNLNELRNKHIAHREPGYAWFLKPPTDMRRAIQLVVEITDDLSGERWEYHVAGLDLRAEVL